MAAGPLLRWRRDRLRALAGRIALPVLVSAAALRRDRPARAGHPLPARCSASPSRSASPRPASRRLWKRNLRRTPLFTWGMVIAHLGIAVALAGMASDSAFTKETLVAARARRDRRGRARSASASTASSRSPGRTGRRSRRGSTRDARRRRLALRPAGADVQRAADADQRGRDPDPARRPALRRCSAKRTSRAAGSCGCGGSRSSP